jgi:hypothetical protein
LITMRPSALWHATTQYVLCLQLRHFDVTTAFLCRTLLEEVNIRQRLHFSYPCWIPPFICSSVVTRHLLPVVTRDYQRRANHDCL